MGCLVQDTYGSIITERVLLADDMPFVYRKKRLLIRIVPEFLHGPYELWKGVICDSDLVVGRKDGKWMYYSISPEGVAAFREMIRTYARCDCEDGNKTGNCCCGVGA